MNKYILFKISALFIIASIVIFYLTYRSKNIALDQHFNGVVQKVQYYGGKMDTKVSLDNGYEYDLSVYHIKSEQNVKKNDSLVKFQNELDLFHYKKNGMGKYYLYKTYNWSSFFGQ